MSTSMDEAKQILKEEMGFCLKCHDHTPCGCELWVVCESCGSENTDVELSHNNGNCFNCNTKLNYQD